MIDNKKNLQVAQFLTCFQNLYRTSQDKTNRNVTTRKLDEEDGGHDILASSNAELLNGIINCKKLRCELIERVLYEFYQWVCGEAQKQKLDLEKINHATHPSSDAILRMKNIFERDYDQRNENSSIHFLLSKFEVWSTKELSNHVLTTSEQSQSNLLNLPSTNIFKKGALKQEYLNVKTGLLVTPNILTWREFLRVSLMVGCLGNQYDYENIWMSPLCSQSDDLSKDEESSPPKKNRNKDAAHLLLDEDAKLSIYDIVALWVRAQRSGSAFRHLLHLFSFKKIENIVSCQRDDEESIEKPKSAQSSCTIKAKYVGNSSKTKIILEETTALESLIEVVVKKQVFFFCHGFQKKRMRKVNDKRNRQDSSDQLLPKPKKSKTLSNEVFMSIDDHTYACRSFVLRWFARRNRQYTRYIFSSHNYEDLELNWLIGKNLGFSEKLRFEGQLNQEQIDKILLQVKDYMRPSTERTLARIDRRIPQRFKSFALFKAAVLKLLHALLHAAPNESFQNGVKDALDDFETLCSLYLDDDVDTVSPLQLDDSNVKRKKKLLVDDSLCEICGVESNDLSCDLLDHPRPWVDQKSTESIPSNEEKYLCSCCSALFHDKFISVENRTEKVTKELLHDEEVLKSNHVIMMFRTENVEKEVPPWGATVDHTRNFLLEVAFLCAGSWSTNVEESSSSILQKMLYSGLIVQDVKPASPAFEAGLKVGDIITKVTNFDSNTENLCGVINGQTKLSIMHLRLEVFRPNISFSAIFQSRTELHYCPNCIYDDSTQKTPGNNSQEIQNLDEESIIVEALACCAIVRRLGMEYSSRPFHDELQGKNQSYQVSLCRLDLMFATIIKQHKKRKHQSTEKEPSLPVLNPFIESMSFLPNGTNIGIDTLAKESTRLSWLTNKIELRPLELLLLGMRILLLEECESFDRHEANRRDLLLRFLPLVSSWCIRYMTGTMPSLEAILEKKMIPRQALMSVSPWIYDRCNICGINKACVETNLENLEDSTHTTPYAVNYCESKSIVCSNPRCKQMLRNLQKYRDDCSRLQLYTQIKEEEMHKRSIEYWSSFVGTLMISLPGDEILGRASKARNESIEHLDRPIEVLVLSYIPHVGGSKNKDMVENDGIFYVVPILSNLQLMTLTDQSKLIKFFDEDDAVQINQHGKKVKKNSVQNEILNSHGVVKIDSGELEYLARQSFLIKQAINNVIFEFGSSSLDAMLSGEMKTKDADNHEHGQSFDALTSLSISEENLLPHKKVYLEDFVMFADNFQNSDNNSLEKSSLQMAEVFTNEYCAMIDLICYSRTKFFTDFSSNVIVLRENFSNKLYFDSDVSESDDDSILMKQNKIGEMHDDEKDKSSSKADDVTTKSSMSICYVDFNLGDQYIPYLPQLVSSGSDEDKEEEVILLKRTEDLNSKKGEDSSFESDNDSEFDPNEILLSNEITQKKKKSNNIKKNKYKGNGWGLELVRWSFEKKKLRVGRVFPNSPAEKANIRPHDIILSINGKEVQTIGPDTSIARAMLLSNKKNDPLDFYDLKSSENPGIYLANRLNQQAEGPVVLKIERTVAPVNNNKKVSNQVGANLKNEVTASNIIVAGKDKKPPASDVNCPTNPMTNEITSQKADGSIIHYEKSISTTKEIAYENGSANALKSQNMLTTNTNTKDRNDSSNSPVSTPNHISNGHNIVSKRNNLVHEESRLKLHEEQLLPAHVERNGFQTFPQAGHASYTNHKRGRPVLSKDHLYASGISGSFFTCVETVILIEGVMRGVPYLGLRLLCPRYDKGLVNEEYCRTIKPFIHSNLILIPKIQESHWHAVLYADYLRSLSEVGPAVGFENGFSYRNPNEILPLDKILEIIMDKDTTFPTFGYPVSGYDAIGRFRVSCRAIEGLSTNYSLGMAHSNEETSRLPQNFDNYNRNQIDDTNRSIRKIRSPSNEKLNINLGDNSTDNHFANDHTTSNSFKNFAEKRIDNSNVLSDVKKREEETKIETSEVLSTAKGIHNSIENTQNNVEGERSKDKNECIEILDSDDSDDEVLNMKPSSSPLRLRGGGSERSSDELHKACIKLIEYHPSTWRNRPVYGFCITTEAGTETGKAKFVGLVKGGNFPNVTLQIMYLSTTGHLTTHLKKTLDANFVNVIRRNTAEHQIWSEIVGKIARRETTWTSSTQSDNTNVLTKSNDKYGIRSSHNVEYFSPQSCERNHFLSLCRTFFDRLCHRSFSLSHLGELPDGRFIYWFVSDPEAIYIQTVPDEAIMVGKQRKFKHCVRAQFNENSRSSKYFCLWGCSAPTSDDSLNLREIFSFSTKQEMLHHHTECHQCVPSKTMKKKSEGLTRFNASEVIRQLCAGLCQSICTRSPTLINWTIPYKQNQSNDSSFLSLSHSKQITFRVESIAYLLHKGRQSEAMRKLIRKRQVDAESRRMLRLCYRLCRLFEVEQTGVFRFINNLNQSDAVHDESVIGLSNDTLDKVESIKTSEKLRNEKKQLSKASKQQNKTSNIDENISQRRKEYLDAFDTKCASKSVFETKCDSKKARCEVCSFTLNGQNFLKEELHAQTDDAESKGCLLLCEVFSKEFGQEPHPQIFAAAQKLFPLQGKMDATKLLLLRVACRIPKPLRSEETSNKVWHNNRACPLFFWKKEFLEKWITFVIFASSSRMLVQAFTTFISYIDVSKLPKWWRDAQFGWASTLGSMNNATLSSLAMKIFVFDAAVAECLSHLKPEVLPNKKRQTLTDKSTKSRPVSDALKKLLQMNIKEKMKLVIGWADKMSLPRFNGESNDECMICEEGGDLMCCEFCVNVQHITCCNPPLINFPEFDWVCDQCVHEIFGLLKDPSYYKKSKSLC